MQRKDETGTLMHNIRYNYTDTTKNHLSDISATGLNSGTYQYDALGNLVRDNAEGLTIGWNALGKVDTIRRNDVLISSFRYSPTGQRQVKATGSDTTFYIHDATGNVMCVYRLKNDTLTASERYIYGSKRLGMLGQQVWITAGGAARLQDRNTIGHRLYELTDHLGNVAVTFPDQKWLTHDANSEPIYQLEVSSFTDYYPFGFPMPVRSFNTGGYRYSFNGQEADDEVYGEGTLHAFEYRMHDTRIGRFWSVDPLAGDYPYWSTYQFAGLMPTWYEELEGLEPATSRPARTVRKPAIGLGPYNYARIGDVRLPSLRTTTTYTYRIGTPTGYRSTVSMPITSYIYTYHSPQGNNIPMTPDNRLAQVITLFGDWCDVYLKKIESKVNTPSGFRVEYRTQVKFSAYRLQYQFDLMQLEYESQFQRLFNELPNTEMEFPTYMLQSWQQLWKDAEKAGRVRDILGPSPQNYLDRIIFFGDEKPYKVESKTEDIPEYRPAEP